MKYIKKIALGAAFIGGLWNGAEAASTYTPGTEANGGLSGTTRVDNLLIGTAGDFNGYAFASNPIKILRINVHDEGTVGPNGATTVTDFQSTITDIYIQGDASAWQTAVAAATGALPVPPKNCKIHFNLSAAPGAGTTWFLTGQTTYGNNLPSWSVYVEPGSSDPGFEPAFLSGIKALYLGAPIAFTPGSAANGILNGSIIRHPATKVSPTLTLAGTDEVVFKSVDHIKLASGAATPLRFTQNATVEAEDTNVSTGTLTLDPGKKLTVKGVSLGGAAFTSQLPASGNVTLGSRSKVDIVTD